MHCICYTVLYTHCICYTGYALYMLYWVCIVYAILCMHCICFTVYVLYMLYCILIVYAILCMHCICYTVYVLYMLYCIHIVYSILYCVCIVYAILCMHCTCCIVYTLYILYCTVYALYMYIYHILCTIPKPPKSIYVSRNPILEYTLRSSTPLRSLLISFPASSATTASRVRAHAPSPLSSGGELSLRAGWAAWPRAGSRPDPLPEADIICYACIILCMHFI